MDQNSTTQTKPTVRKPFLVGGEATVSTDVEVELAVGDVVDFIDDYANAAELMEISEALRARQIRGNTAAIPQQADRFFHPAVRLAPPVPGTGESGRATLTVTCGGYGYEKTAAVELVELINRVGLPTAVAALKAGIAR